MSIIKIFRIKDGTKVGYVIVQFDLDTNKWVGKVEMSRPQFIGMVDVGLLEFRIEDTSKDKFEDWLITHAS